MCCICPDQCHPVPLQAGWTCGCPCHKTHKGLALEDGTFANCPCGRWSPEQLITMAFEDWAECGDPQPPDFVLEGMGFPVIPLRDLRNLITDKDARLAQVGSSHVGLGLVLRTTEHHYVASRDTDACNRAATELREMSDEVLGLYALLRLRRKAGEDYD